jgi:hypothetical protein
MHPKNTRAHFSAPWRHPDRWYEYRQTVSSHTVSWQWADRELTVSWPWADRERELIFVVLQWFDSREGCSNFLCTANLRGQYGLSLQSIESHFSFRVKAVGTLSWSPAVNVLRLHQRISPGCFAPGERAPCAHGITGLCTWMTDHLVASSSSSSSLF